MNATLTDRQRAVLDFLTSHIEAHGYPPSAREVQRAFGFASVSVATAHLKALERKGAILREPGRARGITIPQEQARRKVPLLTIPVLGAIPAGMPDGTEPHSDTCITIDAESLHLPRNARTFALRVRGESMTGAGIHDGDAVILEFREARNRDIVAALIDGETTLKRFVMQRSKPFLKAENPKYPDLIPAQELVIQGVMVALLRVPHGQPQRVR